MNDWLRYTNQSATRNRPLDPRLVEALSFLPELGVTAEVFSGGQPGIGEGGGRVGSTRHDHGNAGDMFFYQGDRRLDWANPDDLPIFEQIVQRGKQNGITGFGAGEGYMRPGSMHIGFGTEGVWGAGGKGANAAPWLSAAFNGVKGGTPPVAPTGSGGIQMAGGPPAAPSSPAAPAATNRRDEAFSLHDSPIGQLLGLKAPEVSAKAASKGVTPGGGLSKGDMSDILSLIGGASGGKSTPPPQMLAPVPQAHIPQVDPTFLSRIAMGR